MSGSTLVKKGALVTCISEDHRGVMVCQCVISGWEEDQKGECLARWKTYSHLHPMEAELVRSQTPS